MKAGSMSCVLPIESWHYKPIPPSNSTSRFYRTIPPHPTFCSTPTLNIPNNYYVHKKRIHLEIHIFEGAQHSRTHPRLNSKTVIKRTSSKQDKQQSKSIYIRITWRRKDSSLRHVWFRTSAVAAIAWETSHFKSQSHSRRAHLQICGHSWQNWIASFIALHPTCHIANWPKHRALSLPPYIDVF